jgi:hypothetical protein
MIYDAVERAYAVVNTNFATDLAAIIADKGVAGLTATASIVKRQRAETYLALGLTLPGLGVWSRGTVTQAKVGSGWRDNVSTIVLDYYCVDVDPVKAAKQAELAAEALLRSIDRIPGSGDGAYGAGELRGSVVVEMSDGFLQDGNARWFRRAQVSFPLTERDEPV